MCQPLILQYGDIYFMYSRVDSVLDPWAFQLIVTGSRVLTMPDGSNVRKAIADTVHKVQKKLLKDDEGDTLSTRNIIQVCLQDINRMEAATSKAYSTFKDMKKSYLAFDM